MAEPVSFESQLESFQPDDQQLDSIRKDGQVSGIDLEGAANILDVYHRLENKRPQDAPTIIITMLRTAGFSEAQLESLEEYVRRVRKDKPQMPPSSNNQDQFNLGMLLVNKLNPALSERQLKRVKLVFEVLGILRLDLDSCSNVSDVYRLVEHKIPKKSVSWLIQILVRIGVPAVHLVSLKPYIDEEVCIEGDIMVDLILTLTDVLENLSEEFYRNFIELVIRTHLRTYNPDNLTCRIYLLHLLLERNHILPDQLGYFFAWLEAIGCQKQHKALRKFCERHGIVEPQWEHLVESIKEERPPSTESPTSESYSQPTSQDGYKQDRTHKDLTDPSEFMGEYQQQPTENLSRQNSSLVMTPASNPVNKLLMALPNPVEERGRDRTAHTSSSQYRLEDVEPDCDPNRPDPFTIPPQPDPCTVPPRPDPRTVPPQPDPRTVPPQPDPHTVPPLPDQHTVPPRSDPHTVPPQPDSHTAPPRSDPHSVPPQPDPHILPPHSRDHPLQVDPHMPPPQSDPHTLPGIHTSHPQPFSNTSAPQPDLSINKPPNYHDDIIHHRPGKKTYSKDQILCCCCTSIITLLSVVLFIAVIIFGIFKCNVFAPSSSTVAYIGGNTTNKIACYDPAYIKHVTIAKGSKEDEYDTQIYKTVQNEFRYQIQTLKNKNDDSEEDHNNRKIAINYYYGDDPVYVARCGNLTYEVRGQSLSELSSHCPLEFYLFNNKGDYDTFINEDFSLPFHATKTSGCLPVNSTARNYTIQFSLDEPGFYFVGVSLLKNVHIDTTISGSIVEFNTSELSEEPCSLNYNDKCTITITKSKLPSVTSQDGHVCVLVKSFGYEYHNINISVEFVEWNSVSVGTGIVCVVITVFLVSLILISVLIFVKRRYKIANRRNEYTRL